MVQDGFVWIRFAFFLLLFFSSKSNDIQMCTSTLVNMVVCKFAVNFSPGTKEELCNRENINA